MIALYWASNDLSTKASLSIDEAFMMTSCVVTNIPLSSFTKIHMRSSYLIDSSWLAVPSKTLFLIFLCNAISVGTFAVHLMSSKCEMPSFAAAPR